MPCNTFLLSITVKRNQLTHKYHNQIKTSFFITTGPTEDSNNDAMTGKWPLGSKNDRKMAHIGCTRWFRDHTQ